MALLGPDIHDRPGTDLHDPLDLGQGRSINPVLGIAEPNTALLDRLPDPGAAFQGSFEHDILRNPESDPFPFRLVSEIARERFFADDLFARLCRGDDHLFMQVCRDTKIDHIHVFALEKSPVIGVDGWDIELLGRLLSALLGPGSDPDHLHLGPSELLKVVQMKMGCKLRTHHS